MGIGVGPKPDVVEIGAPHHKRLSQAYEEALHNIRMLVSRLRRVSWSILAYFVWC